MSAFVRAVALGLVGLWALGCNTFDAPSGEQGGNPTVQSPPPPLPAAPTPDGVFVRPVEQPLDDSPVVTSEQPPPPIEGGTLLVTSDGRSAVIADADRDRVVIVDLQEQAVRHELTLSQGVVPGRLVEDADGRVHVVLRRTGQVAHIEVDSGTLLGRTEVCAVPRGIDYRDTTDSVMVACASGELIELAADDGEPVSQRMVEPDLQDVVVTSDDRMFVTLFKRAELLEIDDAGAVLSRRAPTTLKGPFHSIAGASPDFNPRTFRPAVAWAAIETPSGDVAMVHQRAQEETIDIGHPGEDRGEALVEGGYGGANADPNRPSCTAIVQNGITMMNADGAVHSMSPIAGLVLPVDGAVSDDGRWLAVASAGPRSSPVAPGNFGGPLGAAMVDLQATPDEFETCLMPGFNIAGGTVPTGQATGVAFDRDGRLLVQTRAPAQLWAYPAAERCSEGECAPDFVIALGGAEMRDTGHDLFHRNAGRGVACASCHPGGGDDGVTWNFSNLGPRRTQLFTMGIKQTEPLHWDGDMRTFEQLVDEVFVRRMGGAPQSDEHVAAMANWIDSLEPHPPLRSADEPAVLRGQALFESSEVGCSDCHTGALLTNNASVDVGTGGRFQVPSLVNVVYHQPYMHNGCATTLQERFDPNCGGGDMHGRTSQLNADDIGDLVAYLESL